MLISEAFQGPDHGDHYGKTTLQGGFPFAQGQPLPVDRLPLPKSLFIKPLSISGSIQISMRNKFCSTEHIVYLLSELPALLTDDSLGQARFS